MWKRRLALQVNACIDGSSDDRSLKPNPLVSDYIPDREWLMQLYRTRFSEVRTEPNRKVGEIAWWRLEAETADPNFGSSRLE
jgi:hypothetical protein